MAGSTAPIVLGFDGSLGSREALKVARTAAKALDAEVIVAFGYAAMPVGGETRDEEKLIKGAGADLADEAATYLREQGVEVSIELVHDRPAAAILEVAAARGAQMIVVGSRGEGPLLGAILGSVPYKLVHMSKIPVMVVPPADDEG
jgi:nucleotide-binding universal stress UspA family protein